MRYIITTPAELVTLLEREKDNLTLQAQAARTQKERNYINGKFAGITEALFYINEHIKTLGEKERETTLPME